MLVSEAVGRALSELEVDVMFGLMGSGNLAFTNAARDAGVAFHAARHESGAVCMADGYARVSGRMAAVSVHQGPGLTNAITGLTEAAKSRTPIVVLAADTPAAARNSNFRID
jgi:thiamine pyrophosphate-dependent acetolactate synthase large subunit-like protein